MFKCKASKSPTLRTWYLSYTMNLSLLGHWNGLQWLDLVVTEEPSRFAVGTS